MTQHELGDQPIEPQFELQMNVIARALQELFNGKGCPISESKVGFILMSFNLGEDKRANYISNCHRPDVVTMLKEQVKHFEQQEKET